jgi:hypothetical protein
MRNRNNSEGIEALIATGAQAYHGGNTFHDRRNVSPTRGAVRLRPVSFRLLSDYRRAIRADVQRTK